MVELLGKWRRRGGRGGVGKGSHAEVCRPLLTVSGDTLLETLHLALQQVLDAQSSESAIRGLVADVSVLAVGWLGGSTGRGGTGGGGEGWGMRGGAEVQQRCSHAEVCHPLLTVSGDTLLEALQFALQQVVDAQ